MLQFSDLFNSHSFVWLIAYVSPCYLRSKCDKKCLMAELIQCTVKILKIGTPEIITKIVLQLEQLDFTVQYCVQKMQTE